MKVVFRLGLPFTLTLLATSCAADRQARSTAADLTQAVLKYEKDVDAKVAAEKTFYHDQLATLRKALGGNDAVTTLQRSIGQTQSDEVKSLPYMRVVTSANRDARMAADGLITGAQPPSITAMIEYVDKGVQNEREEYLGYLERQRELTKTLGDNLQPIEQQKAKAANVRSSLAELAKPKSRFSHTKEYAKFAKEVYDLSKPSKSSP
jgi:hypothetical protein